MKDFWYRILRGNREAMQKIDEASVKALELTAPGTCRADARVLYGKVKSGQIFGAFSEHDREAIWAEVRSCTTDRLIPSSAFRGPKLAEGPGQLRKTADALITLGDHILRSGTDVLRCEPESRPVRDPRI
jgi:hypothetical protein